MDMPVWQVVVLGICTVFVVLVCIIIICNLMSFVISKFVKEPAPVSAPVAKAPVVSADKQQILIAICVAIAEQTGVDVSKIRIHSINKV